MRRDEKRLEDVGRELVRLTDRNIARYRILSTSWNDRVAESARDDVCAFLDEVAGDDTFWYSLQQAAPPKIEQYVLEQLDQLAIDEFEDAERELLVWAGADSGLASAVALSTSTLLCVIRDGYRAGNVNVARWVEADREREFVRLAAQLVCHGPQFVAAQGYGAYDRNRAERENAKRAARFRKRLWGSIKVGGGVGQIALNAAILVGAAPILGVNVGTTVLGGGSILGGVWTTVAGGESLHESLEDRHESLEDD